MLDDAAYNDDATTTTTGTSTATAGTVTYTGPHLTWTGDLAPGDTATITFSVTVNSPDTGNHLLASTLTSAAAGSNCPAAGTDPRCTTTVPVADLVINFTASAGTVIPGGTLGLHRHLHQHRADPLLRDQRRHRHRHPGRQRDQRRERHHHLRDPVHRRDRHGLDRGHPHRRHRHHHLPRPGRQPRHHQHPHRHRRIHRTRKQLPARRHRPRCTPTTQILTPALTITKTATVSTTSPGSAVGYTITVADTGQTSYSPATVTDSLSGVLGDAAYNGDAPATATAGTVSYASQVLTWTGNLAPGDTATITYSVTVDNPDTGGKVLSNAAASADPGSTCPAGSTGSPCAVTVPVIAGALTITAPGNSNLGSASVGSNLSGDLGTVQVTDNRGFGAGWTATVSSTGFATGTGTPADTIPVSNASYNITALSQATGPATFTPVPVTQLSTAPQPVVSATNTSTPPGSVTVVRVAVDTPVSGWATRGTVPITVVPR